MKVRKKGGALALATILLLTAAFSHHIKRLESRPAIDVPIEQLPMQLGDWTGRDTEGLDVRSQEILRLDRFVKRQYTNSKGQSVLLYIGYWKEQSGEYQAAKHSPELCLPSNGWQIQRKSHRAVEMAEPELPLQAKRIVGESGGRSHMFYYWFFSGQQNYLEEWRALITISLQRFFAGRSDGGIVEITTPLPSGASRAEAIEQASSLIDDFLEEFYPALRELTASPIVTFSNS